MLATSGDPQREPCVGHVEARSVLRCRAESGQPKITRDPGLLLVEVRLRFPNVYARPTRVRRASQVPQGRVPPGVHGEAR